MTEPLPVSVEPDDLLASGNTGLIADAGEQAG